MLLIDAGFEPLFNNGKFILTKDIEASDAATKAIKKIINIKDKLFLKRIVSKFESYNLNFAKEINDLNLNSDFLLDLSKFVDQHNSKEEIDLLNTFWKNAYSLKESDILLLDLLKLGHFTDNHAKPNDTNAWCKMFDELIDLYININ